MLQKYASVQTQTSVGSGSISNGDSGSNGSGGDGDGGDGQHIADSEPEMMYRPRPSRITRKRKGSRSASATPAKRQSVASLRRSTRGEGSVLKGRVVKVQWGGKWHPATVADVDGRGLRVRWKDGSYTDYKADEVEDQVRAPKGAEPLDFSSMRELVEIARHASSM